MKERLKTFCNFLHPSIFFATPFLSVVFFALALWLGGQPQINGTVRYPALFLDLAAIALPPLLGLILCVVYWRQKGTSASTLGYVLFPLIANVGVFVAELYLLTAFFLLG